MDILGSLNREELSQIHWMSNYEFYESVVGLWEPSPASETDSKEQALQAF